MTPKQIVHETLTKFAFLAFVFVAASYNNFYLATVLKVLITLEALLYFLCLVFISNWDQEFINELKTVTETKCPFILFSLYSLAFISILAFNSWFFFSIVTTFNVMSSFYIGYSLKYHEEN